jgi:hypothetical protein
MTNIPLRFKVNDKVQCRTGGWVDAVVVKLYYVDYHGGPVHPYQCKIEGVHESAAYIYASIDESTCIRRRPTSSLDKVLLTIESLESPNDMLSMIEDQRLHLNLIVRELLNCAATFGNTDVLEWLTRKERGVDITQPVNDQNCSVLMVALKNSRYDTLW